MKLTISPGAPILSTSASHSDHERARLDQACTRGSLDDFFTGLKPNRRIRTAPIRALVLLLALTAAGQGCAQTAGAATRPPEPGPLQPVPALEVKPYLGRWYQVAYYPNFFQRQCISDTSATYRDRGDGTLEVLNRCRTASGQFDQALGMARPVEGSSRLDQGWLKPAQLQVSFLPAWLRWTGVGWGDYWVIDRPDHGRYAIVSEPRRQFLWVLSRTPALSAADRQIVRARLLELGFDLERLQDHRHEAENATPVN